ncbi:unnamed protein product [Rotaria sp. Silwood1]|nr:unnamed protein product [Rotaria sp. Silwood1]
MQIVGKKIDLQSHRRTSRRNGRLSNSNYSNIMTNTEQISEIFKLPIELLYSIFDYIDVQTIIFSLRHTCRQFRDIVKWYDRYVLDFDLISMYRLRYICRLIRPDSVISLKLSDDVKTPKQIEYFLSLINIRRFTQLHSLTITQDSEDLFNSIFDHVINCHSFVSFSIYFRPSPPFKHPDFRDYDLTGPTLGPLASVIAQSNLTIFKTNLRSYQLDKILSPIQYSFQHLTIGNCTRKQYYMILRHSPHLQTIVMEHFKRKQNQAIHDSESEENDQFVYDFYHPLTSLTLLEHQGSIFDLEKSLSLTPTLMHLKIIGDISDTIFFMDSSRLEEFIRSKLCSLKHFEIFINGSTNSENLSIDMLIEPFRTSFWIEEKHWFFTCEFLLRLQKFIFYSTPIPTINANYYFGFEKISTSTFDKPNMHTQMMNGVRHLHFSLWDMTYFNFQEVCTSCKNKQHFIIDQKKQRSNF